MSAPRPPSDLSRRTPDLVTIEAGAVLHRFYPAALEPIYFDRSLDGRLNAPDGGFGVLYAAATINGAFAETFLRQPGRQIIPDDLIQAKSLVRLQVLRSLRLIKLAGPGLAKVGATAEVTHGGLPYEIPQAWSAALHAHPADADGIAYSARHGDEAIVDLRARGVEKFITFRSDRILRFLLDQREYEWGQTLRMSGCGSRMPAPWSHGQASAAQ